MHQFTLTVPVPTDFSHFAARISQSSHSLFYRMKDGKLGRVLNVGNSPRFVEFGPAWGDETLYNVIVHAGASEEEEAVKALLTHILALDTPLDEFYRHCSVNNEMDALTKRLYGARTLRDADLFASGISAIISQQLNLSFAARLKQRLWSMTGEELVVDGDVFHSDPSPVAVARLEYSQLRGQQYSQRKAEYVIDFARLVEKGLLDLEALRSMEDEEAMEKICAIRGMGRWTAECILLFGLGRQDLLPAKDVGLQRAVTQVWNLPQRITEGELRDMAEGWKPWGSWYTYYLWSSLAL